MTYDVNNIYLFIHTPIHPFIKHPSIHPSSIYSLIFLPTISHLPSFLYPSLILKLQCPQPTSVLFMKNFFKKGKRKKKRMNPN